MKILFAIVSVFLSGALSAQVISHGDFQMVVPFLQQEDFKGAFEKTNQLLTTTKNDSSDVRGIVTYMNIFSAAGMVTLDQMTFEDFQTNANKYIGHRLVMPAHPCIDSTALGYNTLKFVMHNGLLKGMTTTANKSKSTILCFEYFVYAEPVNPSQLLGRTVRCGGILESVEINPNKSKIWISRLHIRNAFARPMGKK
ncbi:hypothetical protein [Ohtaekwangia koreensis]|uniref:Uncharacterized protein n=1 Tax=Ohtaekwangia koreensis TaxID=688867 RepID=A0A1T5MG82_9BACT|nr:hypothetical protein [Ohtaekwangia koreensis]SKC86944.1 hypothetical protein SAMN05660236_5296 [Ohtaekwangia koreensis]